MKEIAGGRATIQLQLEAIGKMTLKEWKLLVIVLAAVVLLVIFALTYWPWMGYMSKAV